MYDGDTAVVFEPQVLQPTVIPAPRKAKWKYETWSQKWKEYVPVYFHSFTYGASGYDTHFNAEREIVYEQGLILFGIAYPKIMILSQKASTSIHTQSESNDEKGDRGDADYEYRLQ